MHEGKRVALLQEGESTRRYTKAANRRATQVPLARAGILQSFRNASPRQCRSHLPHSIDQLDRCRRRQNRTTGGIPAAGNRRIGPTLLDPTNVKLDAKHLPIYVHTVDRIREGLQALRSVNIL
jgi:hypothetical protein